MKSDERILELPQPIIERLREVIARIRRLQWIKGSLLTLAAAVTAVMAVMAVDAAFSLEAMPLRMGLSLAGLGFTAWVGWTQWGRPLLRKISLTSVARWVETRHPELHERISTAVELLDERHGEEDQGSRELLDAVVQDAVADVGKLDPAQDLSTRRTRPAKWLAGSAVAVLLVLAAIWPRQVPRLLARALAPMADVGNAWADHLRVLTASQTVALGDPLRIEVAVRGSRERVELQMTGADGVPLIEMLTPDAGLALQEGEGGYALQIPAVRGSFSARVVCGKAASAAFVIKAVPRPETGNLAITYHYPDYTGLPEAVRKDASGEIQALTGTRVTVRAPLNRPVAKAAVKIGGQEVAGVNLTTDPAAPAVEWSTVLTSGLDSLWSMQLEDAEGIANRPVDLPIRSLADAPPAITLMTPVEERMELRPVEKLPLTYQIREDIGLSAVQIRIRPQDKAEYLLPPEALPAPQPDTPGEYAGTAVLDLAKLIVPDGQEIRVSLMAVDRLPAELQGPQRAYSREIIIKLNRWSQPMVEKNFMAQHNELRDRMEEVKRELQNAKGRMNDKADRLRDEEKLSENTLKDLEASSAHMEEAQSMLKELTERMKETAYARQTPELQQIAASMVKPAEEQTKNIPLTDKKDARSEMAKNTRDLLEKAIEQLDAEQRQMDQDRESVQQAAQLSDIAEQQQRLAREAAAASATTAAATPKAAAQSQDNPASPAAPASPADPANPTAPSTDTAANSPPPSAPTSPTDEEQRNWLEEQRKVAQRAKQLMEQNQNMNPQGLQDQLKQAAGQAAELAAAAEAMAAREKSLAADLAVAGPAAAPSPASQEARKQQAAAQQDLAGQVAALQEKAKGFQNASARQIGQSTETQEAANQAQSNLEEATGLAEQSSQELASAATPEAGQAAPQDPAKPAGAAIAQKPTETAGSPKESPPATPAPSGEQTASAQSANSDPATKPARPPEPSTPADGAVNAADGQAATPPSPSQMAVPAGQQAAQDSAASLAEAALALKALGQELTSLAGMVGEHSKSLGEGAQQAGTAVDQAVKPQNEQGKAPSMQQGAQASQQAADQLSMAANTMLQAMSIPASAKSSSPAPPSQGKGKPQEGQPKPDGQPGQEGKDGLQMDIASGALPAELAKLGLTQDDWMKLRSSLQGVDGVAHEQIPAEYRELVKAYFGALATGGTKAK
jgi:hypothetical protein